MRLALPGSKSITNRAFLCAAFAKGKSRIYGALDSDDTKVMLEALQQLGIRVSYKKDHIEIQGGVFNSGKLTLDLHNAGTATRFLTAAMAMRNGATTITGDKRMQERPIADLIEGLRQLGADVRYLKQEGCPPIRIVGKSLAGSIKMKGDKSSQYFSALLMLAPLLQKPLRIEVLGDLVSKPYIDTTIEVMKAFGVRVKSLDYRVFEIRPQAYRACDYHVEGDASSASYFSALQFLHGGKLSFLNLPKRSIQGDARFSEVLKRLKGPSPRVIDMEDMPDAAMTLACVAPFVKGQTTITGLSTLKIKETDRLAALESELRKLGVRVSKTASTLKIDGTSKFRSASIATYRDHRMAMAFSVLGTMVPGVRVQDPACTEKTYPNFWLDLEKVYLKKVALGQKNLLLIGMRCSGKTFHGKRLARKLERSFVDLDALIERREKMTISEIVNRKGWPYFRQIEQKICSEFSEEKNLVIASGGGVILSPKSMKALRKNSFTIFLYSDPDVLCERISLEGGRPSLTGKSLADEIHEIWAERRDLYVKYSDMVWDDTSGKSLQNFDFMLK